MKDASTPLLDLPDEILCNIIPATGSNLSLACHRLQLLVQSCVTNVSIHHNNPLVISSFISRYSGVQQLSIPYITLSLWKDIATTCHGLQTLEVRGWWNETASLPLPQNPLPLSSSEPFTFDPSLVHPCLRELKLGGFDASLYQYIPNLQSLTVDNTYPSPRCFPYPAADQCPLLHSVTLLMTSDNEFCSALPVFLHERVGGLQSLEVNSFSNSQEFPINIAEHIPYLTHFKCLFSLGEFDLDLLRPAKLLRSLEMPLLNLSRAQSLGVAHLLTSGRLVQLPDIDLLPSFSSITDLECQAALPTSCNLAEHHPNLTHLKAHYGEPVDPMRFFGCHNLRSVYLRFDRAGDLLWHTLARLAGLEFIDLQVMTWNELPKGIPANPSVQHLVIRGPFTSLSPDLAQMFPNTVTMELVCQRATLESVLPLSGFHHLRALSLNQFSLEACQHLPQACPQLRKFLITAPIPVLDCTVLFDLLFQLPLLRDVGIYCMVIRSQPLRDLLTRLPLHALSLHLCYLTEEAGTVLSTCGTNLRKLELLQYCGAGVPRIVRRCVSTLGVHCLERVNGPLDALSEQDSDDDDDELAEDDDEAYWVSEQAAEPPVSVRWGVVVTHSKGQWQDQLEWDGNPVLDQVCYQ